MRTKEEDHTCCKVDLNFSLDLLFHIHCLQHSQQQTCLFTDLACSVRTTRLLNLSMLQPHFQRDCIDLVDGKY
jgi:hypothetical protein